MNAGGIGDQPALYPIIMQIIGNEFAEVQKANQVEDDANRNKGKTPDGGSVSLLNPNTRLTQKGFGAANVGSQPIPPATRKR